MTDVAPVCAVRTEHAGCGVRARALATALRLTVKPTLTAWSYLPQVIWPAHLLDHLAEYLPPPSGARIDPVHLGPCDAEWIQARPGNDRQAAILYLHGGALVTCSLATHRRLVADISRCSDAPALNVDFRMMPQVTIEHMVADALLGYRRLLEHYPADRIVIAGDSAGGYLALLAVLAAREEDLPMPAAMALLSPLLDLGTTRKAAGAYRDTCDVFTVRTCDGLARYTAAVDAAHEVTGPRIEPIDADLRGLPPLLIQVGSTEILRADAEEMADRLAAAGVPVDLQIWQRQVHVFQAAAPLLPEAREAVRDLGSFVRRHTGGELA